MSSMSLLSHCRTERPGIRAFSRGTNRSRPSVLSTIPPECCPRWRGRPRTLPAGVEERAQPRVRVGHARHAQLLPQREGLRQVAAVEEAREPVQGVVREAEHLADLAHRAPAPVGDHVRRHRRAPAAVPAVHLLDQLLAPLAAGQVQVDVRPVRSPLRQEPLEEQLALDRVDGGDPEGVAHRAVGGAPPPLDQGPALAREGAQVPDDQEIPAEAQLRDERKLALELAPHLADDAPVALLGPEVRHLPQERVLRLPAGTGWSGNL